MAALLAVVGDGDRGVGEFGDCRLRQLWYPVSVTVLYLFLQVTFNGGLVLDYIYRLNQVKY